MSTHHMSHAGEKKIFPMCLHAATYSRLKAQNPTEWDTFCTKIINWDSSQSSSRSDLRKRLMSRLPRLPNKKLKHTAGCMRSRHLTCFEEKVAGFLVYYFYCLRDLTSETPSPISKVISPGFKQRRDSSFDTCV